MRRGSPENSMHVKSSEEDFLILQGFGQVFRSAGAAASRDATRHAPEID